MFQGLNALHYMPISVGEFVMFARHARRYSARDAFCNAVDGALWHPYGYVDGTTCL